MANILVSVVIPTYNHAHFLDRALQSVLAQTYTNWEAIVIDNHSQDRTDEVMRSFADSRIKLLKIHNNGVIAASRNMGIRAAKGEWIAFLDSDDWWAPNKLKICLEHISDKADLIYHDLKIVREESRLFQRKTTKNWQVGKPVLIDLLVNGNAISNSSVVVRKCLLDQIGGIDENPKMIASEDYNTWLRIAQITDKFYYIPESHGYYMVHSQAVSRIDMSVGYKCAVADFIGVLNDDQQNSIKSVASYMKGRHHYLHGRYERVAKELQFCLKNGSIGARFKSLYMIFHSSLRVLAVKWF